jgi:FkbM family methyltransferase
MEARRLAAKANSFVRESARTLTNSSVRKAWFESLVLERVVRRPIVYTDDRGLRYVLYPGENARAYLEHSGNYEVHEAAFCERTISPGATVIDVGANIGLYTLLFSKLVGDTGRVLAFEAAPENVNRLEANLALNDVHNVDVLGVAVSNRLGTADLHLFGTNRNALHSLAPVRIADQSFKEADRTPNETIEVETLTLDFFCADRGIDHVDFLKVDVEGAELHVLEGAERLITEGRVDVIQFEVSLPQVAGFDRDPAGVFAFLKAHGYRTFRFDDAGELERADAPTGIFANYVALRSDAA